MAASTRFWRRPEDWRQLLLALLDARQLTLAVVALAVLVRTTLGFHPHSGEGNPPMYGDYEAQRHWMELTINLPAREWYAGGPHNDLQYWGLDYPPLTALQSMLCGYAIASLEPEAMELDTSHGYESYTSKLYMRWSVLICDILIYFPAILCFVGSSHWSPTTSRHRATKSTAREALKKGALDRVWATAMLLICPPLLLIDHGHFQYNCISLGFTAAAATAVLHDWDVLGSVLFSLAMNHKHMSVYFAPAFFSYLLGKCLKTARSGGRSWLLGVLRLGLAVVSTFLLCWFPWLSSPEATRQVLHRLLPWHRGLFEDYVANFWCTSSLLIKWKRIIPAAYMPLLCAMITLSALMPANIHQIRQPSTKGFLYCMFNSASAFFLFSFQVHEKSILMPLLPLGLLVLEEPVLYQLLCAVACFSMFPLLEKDGLGTAYIAVLLLFAGLARRPYTDSRDGHATSFVRLLVGTSLSLMAVLHVARLLLPPPKEKPFLHDAFMVSLSFVHFFGAMIYCNYTQLSLGDLKAKEA